jgi:hypothetical protein
MNVEDKVDHILLDERTGCGTIYEGKHYTLDYQPARTHSKKCWGVELITREIGTKYSHDFTRVLVTFKETGFFSSKKSFEERLKAAIDAQIKLIQTRENEINRRLEEAQKIRLCQIKIDQTISGLTGKSDNAQIPEPEKNNWGV